MIKIQNKKAEGLPINIIIIAVIGLVVVIIMIAAFTGRIHLFDQAETCSGKGGTCSADGSCPEGDVKMFTKDCKFYPSSDTNKPGQCCVKLQ